MTAGETKNLPATVPPVVELDWVLKTYVNLPDVVDLRLHPTGLDVHTSDFPVLIRESCALDLRQYFVDVFKDTPGLTTQERNKLVDDLHGLFQTIEVFRSNAGFAALERAQPSVIELPPGLSHGFLERMNIEPQVRFRLKPVSADAVSFVDVEGVSFDVGSRAVRLRELHISACDGICHMLPVFEFADSLSVAGGRWQRLKARAKELAFAAAMKLGKVSTQAPVVMDEFREYLSNAVNFRGLIHEPEKDLVMFLERTSGVPIEDPITRSLLQRGMRIAKAGEAIRLEREAKTMCDLGGIFLRMSETIQLSIGRRVDQIDIQQVVGVGVEVPFEAPPELDAIGLNLRRSIPNVISSLLVSPADQHTNRRMVAGTTPGCWIGLDLSPNMQPLVDAGGNWIIFGVTSNPISGLPQRFFLRLDKDNNLNMTPQEIGEILTQTAFEGFDPRDPLTWSWGAIAIGGQTLLTADAILRNTDDGAEIKKTARALGRMIGKILDSM